MYPDFQFFFSTLLGSDAPQWLSLLKTFGFFLAIAFLSGAYVLFLELKRKEKIGLIGPKETMVVVGKKATTTDYLTSAIIGFVLLYKIGGLLLNASEAATDPMTYFVSLKGSFITGLLGMAVAIYMRYADDKKNALPTPEKRKIKVYPHQRVSEIIMIAALGGIAGAKIFNAFETWEDFIKNPIASLISSSGLTFYGGLITATFLLWRFAKRNHIHFAHLCDAAAPALLLAYGIGRLGCHFSGDGDWGIYNSAYVSQADGSLQLIPKEKTNEVFIQYQDYFQREYASIDAVPHQYQPAPAALPRWLWAMNYAHNVNNMGVPIKDCNGTYCSMLPMAVFPTSFYEFVVCMILFSLLWYLRLRITQPLKLFGVYLIFNGLERFFIEKIRVNYKYDWGFIHPTQAEIISTLLVLCGVALLLFYNHNNKKQPTTSVDT